MVFVIAAAIVLSVVELLVTAAFAMRAWHRRHPDRDWQPTGYRYTTPRTYDESKAVPAARRADREARARRKLAARRAQIPIKPAAEIVTWRKVSR